MSHEEAGGLVLLLALVLVIVWVLILRWENPDRPPRWSTSQTIGITPPPDYDPPIMAFEKTRPPDRTPQTSLASAGSPCRAQGCPALRYAPLDEHSITAHHRHDNLRS